MNNIYKENKLYFLFMAIYEFIQCFLQGVRAGSSS